MDPKNPRQRNQKSHERVRSVDKEQLLLMVKARLGISSAVRDEYLKRIIDGVIDELENEKGLALEGDTAFMFIVDYAAWRYDSRGESGGLPDNLRWRLQNMMLHSEAPP